MFTDKQWEYNELLKGEATHILGYGGGRSGKTYLFTTATAVRAMRNRETTHAILRHRFNHLKASIIFDTFPMVMKTEFPDVTWELNKTDWFVDFPHSGSRIYFGGLDEKERTEKILGQGHSTIYLNEGTQIAYSARTKAVTRLSQNKGCRLRSYTDCNPPNQGHWIYKLHIKKLEPITGQPLRNPESYTSFRMNPVDNPHLPEETLRILENLPLKDRKRFYEGEFVPMTDNALWTYDQLEGVRIPEGYKLPEMSRIVISVDPSGCRGPEDKRSDEVGIVAVGLGEDGHGYVLEDASGRFGPGGPDGWGQRAVNLYRKWSADAVLGETNFGGAMVEATVRAADSNVPFREVHASRGKTVRADPVSTLYGKGIVHHLDIFPEMEEQMCNFSTAGYIGERSPDRVDAMVWGITDILVGSIPHEGMLNWYIQEAKKLPQNNIPKLEIGWNTSGHDALEELEVGSTVKMRTSSGVSVFYGHEGRRYVVGGDGTVEVHLDDVPPARNAGFVQVVKDLAA
jgi:hypothetical protein